jgi:23S rRNA (adenine2503-C2)-methyltransferase
MTDGRVAVPSAGEPRSWYDLEPADLARLASDAGQPAYRSRQLAQQLDRRKVADPEAMTDLPAGFREYLRERLPEAGLVLERHQVGDDGWTHKFLFGLQGGDSVESVLMFYPPAYPPAPDADGAEPEEERGRQGRATLCISTQAGCAMGCTFCATGQFGFTRNLSAGEVVEQVARVWGALDQLRPDPSAPDHLTNVVFMGMGEPFANPAATWRAAWRIHEGFGLSARGITISTVGLVPGIHRAARERLPVNLAISIHAGTDELRSRLVPLNHSWPIADLIEAVRAYVAATRRRVSFEYALIRDLNDGADQAEALGRLLSPLRMPGSGGHAAHVNLIPYNPTPGLGLETPSRAAVERFREVVAAHGLAVSVRANRGVGIAAACGQLRTSVGRPGRTVEVAAPASRPARVPAGAARPTGEEAVR